MGEVGRPIKGRWQAGESGNPDGRPLGTRNKFSEAYFRDLAAVWAEHGKTAMEKTASDEPGQVHGDLPHADSERRSTDNRTANAGRLSRGRQPASARHGVRRV